MPRELIDHLHGSKWKGAQESTWGHLKAKPGRHPGYMVFTCGEYGDIVSIASVFKDIGGSPWFFQAHMDFINDQEVEDGMIYVFRGEYIRQKGDDCGRFVGKVEPLDPAALLNLLK